METIIRLSATLGIFFIMVGWEFFSPRRSQHLSRKQRWPINLGLAALNLLIMRLSVGGIAYLSAVNASEHQWGLLHSLAVPQWLAVIATLLVLDFAIYCQHIVSHRWPLLWRLHQVHHTDLEFDATTAVRFHPLEIVISMLYKVLCIYLLGAEPHAVIAFEIILNGAATFNHSNVRIAPAVDKALRYLLVTPDMHRIHHSSLRAEIDSNYGFSISCWDRLCKTYVAEPEQPQTSLTLGLAAFRQQQQLGFIQLLLLPFKALKR